jgi:nucleotide-binding universal stress UspA family protein
MSRFGSILVPLDGSRTAAQSLGCAAWLAGRLGARLHVLSVTPQEEPAPEVLRRLGVGEAYWPLITLHQAPAYPAAAILSALARYEARLVVLTARGEGAEALAEARDRGRIVGHVTRAVIERSPVPVLLLPPGYRERLPWTRVLVPLSGEADADDALAIAVKLAEALDLEVSVAHVADTSEEGLAARARYADAVHHEYPGQLGELVSRLLPHCSPDEPGRIEAVALCHGDVAGQLLEQIEGKGISVVVAGWHGRFEAGHARVLKQLLRTIAIPVLLVRPVTRAPFRLRVGEEIE